MKVRAAHLLMFAVMVSATILAATTRLVAIYPPEITVESRLVLPIITAPEFFSLVTTVASYGGMKFSSILEEI